MNQPEAQTGVPGAEAGDTNDRTQSTDQTLSAASNESAIGGSSQDQNDKRPTISGDPVASARSGSAVADSDRSAHVIGRRLLEIESNTVLVALISLVVILGVLHPNFLTISQFSGVIQQSSYIAVLAAGMAFLISMREIDLSVGGTFSLCMVAGAIFMKNGMDPWIACVLAIAIGAAAGLLNAIFVELITLPTIVATLATMSMFSGLALAIGNGEQITGFPTSSSFFSVLGGNIGGVSGIPTAVPILIGLVIVLTAVLRLTPFGYRVREIGSNPESAAFSGIRVSRVRIQTLTMMGLLAGFSAMLGLAFFETGDPNMGNNFALEVIAAAIIGGTPLRGGSATVVGAMLGAILLGVVNTGLAYFNVPVNWSEFATGAVILFAVSLDSMLRRRRRARAGGLAL